MKTPVKPYNRPGLGSLRYRVGTYGEFVASMLARLSDDSVDFKPLNRLRTRDPDDPTIALIDAFACVGEVLTFYQERLVNEGYLRTGTEPRSLLELSRLTGYRLRPGVAASVALAFTLDPGSAVTLPAGIRAQSVPGPGEMPQSYETSEALMADGVYNAMSPRLTRPIEPAADLAEISVTGTSTGLKPNDMLLLVVDGKPTPRRVAAVDPQFDRKRTVVKLQAQTDPASRPPAPPASAQPAVVQDAARYASLARKAPAEIPRNVQAVRRTSAQLFTPGSDAVLRLIAGSAPDMQAQVFSALARTPLAAPSKFEVFAFRTTTAPFGNRAPPQTVPDGHGKLPQKQEWEISTPVLGEEQTFSFELAGEHNGLRALVNFIREIGHALSRGASFSEGVGFSATVTFDGKKLKLSLTAENHYTASGSFPDGIGDVTVKLSDITAHPLALEATVVFGAQPLALRVTLAESKPPTVINQRQTDAMVTLTAGESFLDVLHVRGALRKLRSAEASELPNILHLDGVHDAIIPGSWVVFDSPLDNTPPPLTVLGTATIARSAYGQTARTTRLTLSGTWLDPERADFRNIRETTVYADSTALTLVEEDISDPLAQPPGEAPRLELDGLVPGLSSGRWLIVAGERTDLPGVVAAELVMLLAANHDGDTSAGDQKTPAPGELPHTTLTLVSPLAFSYKRDTVKIFGNVAMATMGESGEEILGSGNGALANQAFTLKKKPLTYVPAASPSGNSSTLVVRVNNTAWSEAETLATAAPQDRVYVTSASDNGSLAVTFGDGVNGARLPTGTENIRASYRTGIGAAGNVAENTITTLLSRPLGLKSVTNPIAAAGGADAEGIDSIRANIPLGLLSLSRLVSVSDYRDFALGFAGVGKAQARLFDGNDGALVYLTIAPAAVSPFAADATLWTALEAALRNNGEPALSLELASAKLSLALIQAAVAIEPERRWSDIEPVIRAALLAEFGYAKRLLGQPLYAAEVIATIQLVPGVVYVDLQRLISVPQPTTPEALHAAVVAGGVGDLQAAAARIDRGVPPPQRRILPAELVYLSAALSDMLVLNETRP